MLDDLFTFVRRFVSLSLSQARVIALWIAHTHAIDASDATPYLAITSAEKQSGKNRLLEVCELLVSGAWLTGKVSAAVLIRKIDSEQPSLCWTKAMRRSPGRRNMRRLCAVCSTRGTDEGEKHHAVLGKELR